MTDPLATSPVEIVAISFPSEGLVQVQYAEERDVSQAAAVQRSIMIDTQFLEDELEELLEAARVIVDKGLMLIRNPPKVRRRPRQDVELGGDDPDDEEFDDEVS